MPADVSCKKMDLGVPIAEPLPASGFFGTPKRHETGTYLKGLPAKHIEMLFVLGCFPYFFSENSMGWDSKHSKKVFFFTLRASEDCQAGDVHLHLQVLEPDVLHLQGHGPKELSAGSDVSTFRPVLGMCKRNGGIAVNASGKWIYQRKTSEGLLTANGRHCALLSFNPRCFCQLFLGGLVRLCFRIWDPLFSLASCPTPEALAMMVRFAGFSRFATIRLIPRLRAVLSSFPFLALRKQRHAESVGRKQVSKMPCR